MKILKKNIYNNELFKNFNFESVQKFDKLTFLISL